MIALNSEVETAMKTVKGTLFLIKHQQKKKKQNDEINMHLYKQSVAVLHSSEKCENLLT